MWKSVLQATLTAGTLDIIAACTSSYLSNGVTPDRVLRYIASGVFGKSAFAGGFEMIASGLVFHFIIAFACASCYFWLYPKLPFLARSVWLSAVLVGVVAWIVTTRIIVPMSQIGAQPFNFAKIALPISILIVCIGLPIAYIARQFYHQKN